LSLLRDDHRAPGRGRVLQGDVRLDELHSSSPQRGGRGLRLPFGHRHGKPSAPAYQTYRTSTVPPRGELHRLDALARCDAHGRPPSPVGVVPTPLDPEREPYPYRL